MAEFHFFGTVSDQIDILNHLFRIPGLSLMSCINATGPRPKCFHSVSDELRSVLSINNRVFIAGPYTKKVFTKKIGRQEYTIDYLKGGSLISLALPHCIKDKGIWKLSTGNICYQTSYLDESETKVIKPSDKLKAYFMQVKKLICAQSIKLSFDRPVWIGREGAELFHRKLAWIKEHGLWFRWDGLKPVVADARFAQPSDKH